jgi:hypothetical protein
MNPSRSTSGFLKRVPVHWIRTTPYIFEYINGKKQPETSEGLARPAGACAANPLWFDDFVAIVKEDRR